MRNRFVFNGLAVIVLGAALTFSGCGGSSSSSSSDNGGSTTPTVTEQIELGALVYAQYYIAEAGWRTEPANAAEKDYSRCKGCHGWDGFANAGGYWNRSDGGGKRPAGKNVSTQLTRTDYTVDKVWHAGGRALSTLNESMPDYSDVLSTAQAEAVTAYLNFPGGKFSEIATVTPGDATAGTIATYAFTGADTAAGEALYASNCQGCHQAPGDVNLLGNDSILTFLAKDGKFSELGFKMMWGNPGTSMTRGSMNGMSAAETRDVLAYMQGML